MSARISAGAFGAPKPVALSYPGAFAATGGDLCQEDKTENELSLKYGFRLLSSYQVTDTEKIWIITEADRSVTTLLLPAEY